MTLIAFTSNGRQAGKDTAATFVSVWCAANGYGFERRAFADKMKLLVAASLGIEDAEIHPDPLATVEYIDSFKSGGRLLWWRQQPYEEPEDAIDGRDFIINLAEGARALFGETFWIDQCLPPIASMLPADVTVITDLRFPPEANRVAELSGVVVRINRPGAEGGRSEGALDPLYIDAEIPNRGSLEDLRRAVFAFMDQFVGQKPRK